MQNARRVVKNVEMFIVIFALLSVLTPLCKNNIFTKIVYDKATMQIHNYS